MNEIMFEGSKAVKPDAEISVLGSVLSEPECFNELTYLLPDDFYYQSHKTFWQILKYLSDTDQPLDIPSITSALQDADKFEEIGGRSFIISLINSVSTTKHVKHYANIVKQAATLRRTIQTVDQLQNKLASASPEDAEKTLDEATRALETVRPDASSGLQHISEFEKEYFQELEKKDAKVRTGFDEYDKLSGGLSSEDLYILAGRPSVGKTAKMLQMAGGVARQDKGAVLIWSQEMSKFQVMDRILSSETGIPYNFLTNDKDMLEPKHWDKIQKKYKDLNALPIYVKDAAGVSMSQIKAAIRSFKARKGKIAAVFVDYLQIMDIPVLRGESEASAIGKTAQEAKNIARKEKLTFVLLSQMNRDIEYGDRKPGLKDLKGSGGIEQAADVVEFLYEHSNDIPDNPRPGEKIVRSLIAKARNFHKGEIKCIFEGWCQRYIETDFVKPGEDEQADEKKRG